MADLTAEEILARIEERKAETKAIDVPEWGGTVYIRKLSVGDLPKFSAVANGADPAAAIVKNLEVGLCDAKGKPLFDHAKAQKLLSETVDVAGRISQEINRYNGLTAEAVEEATEDFGGAQSDGSSSG